MVQNTQQTDQKSPDGFEEFFEKYQQGMSIVLEGAQAETGKTPKETIWTKNKAKLYRYQTTAEKKYETPILFVFALINKPYILDLMPGNSLIHSSHSTLSGNHFPFSCFILTLMFLKALPHCWRRINFYLIPPCL